MDAIRARGFLRFTYVYKPPNDIKETIKGIAEQVGLKLDAEKWQNTHLSNYAIKEELLKKSGNSINTMSRIRSFTKYILSRVL